MKTKDELEQELTALKAKYKTVYSIEAPLNDEGLIATIFLKKPDRVAQMMIGKLVSKDKYSAIEAGLKNLYIGGDEIKLVTENDDALLSCEDALVEMLSVQKATLKKN
jgi:hypothetical protein